MSRVHKPGSVLIRFIAGRYRLLFIVACTVLRTGHVSSLQNQLSLEIHAVCLIVTINRNEYFSEKMTLNRMIII